MVRVLAREEPPADLDRAHAARDPFVTRGDRLGLGGVAGLVVVRARDAAEAEAIAARDPFVTRGVRAVEVRRWLLSCEDSNHLL